jgi:hypothetical protein
MFSRIAYRVWGALREQRLWSVALLSSSMLAACSGEPTPSGVDGTGTGSGLGAGMGGGGSDAGAGAAGGGAIGGSGGSGGGGGGPVVPVAWIAFEQGSSLVVENLHPDGTGRSQTLTQASYGARWSADGARLAVADYEANALTVWSMTDLAPETLGTATFEDDPQVLSINAPGSTVLVKIGADEVLLDVTTMTTSPIDYGHFGTWSPDGQWLAYKDGAGRIALTRGGQVDPTTFTSTATFDVAGFPRWDDDGDFVLVPIFGLGHQIVDVSSGTPTQPASPGNFYLELGANDHAAFEGNGPQGDGVYVAQVAGTALSDIQMVAAGPASDLRWSADGTRLLYVADAIGGDMFVVDVSGSSVGEPVLIDTEVSHVYGTSGTGKWALYARSDESLHGADLTNALVPTTHLVKDGFTHVSGFQDWGTVFVLPKDAAIVLQPGGDMLGAAVEVEVSWLSPNPTAPVPTGLSGAAQIQLVTPTPFLFGEVSDTLSQIEVGASSGPLVVSADVDEWWPQPPASFLLLL